MLLSYSRFKQRSHSRVGLLTPLLKPVVMPASRRLVLFSIYFTLRHETRRPIQHT